MKKRDAMLLVAGAAGYVALRKALRLTGQVTLGLLIREWDRGQNPAGWR